MILRIVVLQRPASVHCNEELSIHESTILRQPRLHQHHSWLINHDFAIESSDTFVA